jgi:hypothetical protein
MPPGRKIDLQSGPLHFTGEIGTAKPGSFRMPFEDPSIISLIAASSKTAVELILLDFSKAATDSLKRAMPATT